MSGPFALVWSIASIALMGALIVIVLVVPGFQHALKMWVTAAIVAGAVGAVPISLYATKALLGR